MWVAWSMLSSFTVTPFNISHWQQVMEIRFSFISSRATTKVQNRIKRRRETLPLLMLRPFENLLAIRGATMLQGRITEQRDGAGIWNEVLELPSLLHLLHLFYLDIQKKKNTFNSFQCRRNSAGPRYGLSLVSISLDRCGFVVVVVLLMWFTWALKGWAERGKFIHHEEEVQHSPGSKCKVDKWLITSRSEMIHHFLELSSLKGCLWRYISVSSSRSSCLLHFMNREKYMLQVLFSHSGAKYKEVNLNINLTSVQIVLLLHYIYVAS